MALYFGGAPSGVGPNKFDAGIDEVKEAVADVQTSVDGVQDSIDGLSTGLQDSMDQLVTDVGEQVEEMQQTLDQVPAATIPPSLEEFSSQSEEDGIKLTYKARFVSGRLNATQDECWIFSQTKGVMFRYSTGGYPKNRNDGTLAFVDEDIFTVSDDGKISAKTCTGKIVGLTTNTKYYISAFPYSTYNVYNETLNVESPGLNNTTSCTWTGTKGTLTVNVTQNYNYKELGELSATVTPTSGGDGVTQSRTGAGEIVFSNLEAGDYSVSFTAPTYYTAPSTQSVSITAGQPNTITAQYKMSTSMSTYSWADIFQFAQMGVTQNLFSYGSKKQTLVAPITGNAESGYTVGTATQKNVIFIGTNNHATNTSTFVTENLGSSIRIEDFNNGGGNVFPYSNTEYFSFLATTYTAVFPEIHQYIKQVSATTRNNNGGNDDHYDNREYANTNFTARIFPMVNKANRNYQYLTSDTSSRYNLENGAVWIGCSTGEYHWGSTDYNMKVYNGYTEGRYYENNSGDRQELRVSSTAKASPIVFCIG